MSSLEPRDPQYKNAIITIPNIICFVRLIGAFVLFAFAIAGWRNWFVGLFLVLSLSDWVDGRLARWLHQRSDFGARLDSFADATLYAGLIGGALILCWETLRPEWIWLVVCFGSYALTTGMGLWKFGRVPSYHTYGAKASNWLALIGGISLVLSWSIWPMRIAIIAVTLTNLEATVMTCVLNEWRADILTLFHIWPEDKDSVKSSGVDAGLKD